MKIIVLFVILLLVPLLIGRLVADIIKKEYCMKPGFWYLSGFLTMLALYQIICVPMTLKEYSFSKLVICYSIILGILSAIALWKYAGAACHRTSHAGKAFKLLSARLAVRRM